MKHIVIDARESGTSTGRYIDKLVEYLHELIAGPSHPSGSGLDYRITLLAKPHRLKFYNQLAPNFTAVACPHKEFSFAEQIGLKLQIERLKPDLVHFPAVQQPVWLNHEIPVVTTMQDLTTLRFRNPAKNALIFTAKQRVYRWVNQRVADKSTALITPSAFVKDDIVAFSGVDAGKITVTHEAADPLPKPSEAVPGLAGKDFIMYIGRPTPHKNLERLITAFSILSNKHHGLHLVLAGKKDANYNRIEAMAERQGIANVVFTGFISDQQLRWMYEHCQAYVFPSLSEGFGLPGLEAMLHGAPVVSSNATCLPEIYGNGAHYFNPLDPTAMATSLAEVIDDNALRQMLIKAGERQAKTYSWRRMAEQTLAVYQAALAE